MKTKEMRQMTVEELQKQEKAFREELFNLRYQLNYNMLKNTQRVPQLRHDIARIKTIIKEKEGAGEAQK